MDIGRLLPALLSSAPALSPGNEKTNQQRPTKLEMVIIKRAGAIDGKDVVEYEKI